MNGNWIENQIDAPAVTDSRMRQALEWIGTECQNYTTGIGSCWGNRRPDAKYGADRWCDGCIAAWGLAVKCGRASCVARTTFLKAALQDILGRVYRAGDNLPAMNFSWDNVASWRAILDDKPGQLSADGSCKEHDFQPDPDDPELGHLNVHKCTRCGSRWLPARGERT